MVHFKKRTNMTCINLYQITKPDVIFICSLRQNQNDSHCGQCMRSSVLWKYIIGKRDDCGHNTRKNTSLRAER